MDTEQRVMLAVLPKMSQDTEAAEAEPAPATPAEESESESSPLPELPRGTAEEPPAPPFALSPLSDGERMDLP
eukprot:1554142-Alexandrium_andersonii.AAC.1